MHPVHTSESESSVATSFHCHTSMTKGNREQPNYRATDSTVTRRAASCPLALDSFTAHGVRGVTCSYSTQSWKPPTWVLEGTINSKVETTSCATKTMGSYHN